MAIFHSNSKDLGFLSGETVARITKFYTYLKTCRDLLGQIAEKQEQPNALVRLEFLFASYCFFACLENALYVTAELSEDEGEYKEYANYMLGSCTQAYVFLLYVLWEEREEKERKKSRRLEHLRHNLRLKNFTGTSGEDENDAVGKVIVDEGAFSRYLISIGRLAKMHQESDWVRKNSPPEFMEGMMRNIGMYIDSSVDYETRMMRFDCKAENEIQEKVYEFMKPTVFEGRPLVIKKNIQEYYNEFRKVIGRIEI